MNVIIQLIIGVVLAVASTLIQRARLQDQTEEPHGVRGDIQVGGDNPLAFIMGRYATAGQLEYANTWSVPNYTPNAFLVTVVSVSDLPVRGLAGLFVDGKRGTIGETPDPDRGRGYPVTEFVNKDGYDCLWIWFHDGTQTEADAYLLDKFGGDSERPWLSDMIGRGVAYAIVTARADRELFPNFPEYLFEVDGIPLAGDAHENAIAGIETILLGISYDGAWVYGPQGVTANHIDASFATEQAKCDVEIDLDAGGTEPRFRFGYEVKVDEEPHAVIGEYLKACQGRIAEIGGRYKVLVAEPGAAVKAFTDEDIVITEGQTYEPFPGLEATYNAITATYPEPLETWTDKEAPPRYSSELEADDDGRRLPFHTNYKAVPFANQVQRNMRAAIEEARRFRRHSFTAPPEWWEFEVLDTVEWSSAWNGYIDKLFILTVMEDLPGGNQIVGLQEQDPTDYDWSTTFELPSSVTPIAIQRPAAQGVADFDVVGAEGPGGVPGALFTWGIDEDATVDIDAVVFRIWLPDETTLVTATQTPFWESESFFTSQNLVPDTAYKGQARFSSVTGRTFSWSSLVAFTTPDVNPFTVDVEEDLAAFDAIIQGQIAEAKELQARLLAEIAQSSDDAVVLREVHVLQQGDMTTRIAQESILRVAEDGALAALITSVEASLAGDIAANGLLIASQSALLTIQGDQISLALASITSLQVSMTNAENNISANANGLTSLTATVNAVGTNLQAVSAALALVNAGVGGNYAEALFSAVAAADQSSADARIALRVRINHPEAVMQECGLFIQIVSNVGQVLVLADKFVVANSIGGTAVVPFLVSGGVVYMTDVSISGTLIIQNTLFTELLEANAITVPEFAESSGTTTLTGDGDSGFVDLASFTIDTKGGSVLLLFAWAFETNNAATANTRVVRDSTLISQNPIGEEEFSTVNRFKVDAPSAGSHTYKLQRRKVGDGGTAVATWYSWSLIALGARR